MVKLRFDNLSLKGFNFKLVPKKRQYRDDGNKKLTTRLIKGVCLKEGDEYKIRLDVKALKPDIIEKSQPDILVLDFTEESYELKGLNSVFSRNPGKDGKYIRFMRNETKAKFDYGSKERYVPFCNNWVCSGYIVRRNGKLMFDFNECISPEGYGTFISDEDK